MRIKTFLILVVIVPFFIGCELGNDSVIVINDIGCNEDNGAVLGFYNSKNELMFRQKIKAQVVSGDFEVIEIDKNVRFVDCLSPFQSERYEISPSEKIWINDSLNVELVADSLGNLSYVGDTTYHIIIY